MHFIKKGVINNSKFKNKVDQGFIGFVTSWIIPGLSKVRKKIRKKQRADISYRSSSMDRVQEGIPATRPDELRFNIGNNRCFCFIFKIGKRGNRSTFKAVGLGESEIKPSVSIVRLTIDQYIASGETVLTSLLYDYPAGSPIKRTYTNEDVGATSLALLTMAGTACNNQWRSKPSPPNHWKRLTMSKKSSTGVVVVILLENGNSKMKGDLGSSCSDSFELKAMISAASEVPVHLRDGEGRTREKWSVMLIGSIQTRHQSLVDVKTASRLKDKQIIIKINPSISSGYIPSSGPFDTQTQTVYVEAITLASLVLNSLDQNFRYKERKRCLHGDINGPIRTATYSPLSTSFWMDYELLELKQLAWFPYTSLFLILSDQKGCNRQRLYSTDEPTTTRPMSLLPDMTT
jgi:hypothetical protein